MADTPRVTVPVDPTEAMKIAGVHAIDNVQPNDVSMWVTACWSAMLSAAPAPEGGAVLEDALDSWIVEGMKKADQRIAEITPVGCSGMTPEDVETGRVSAYQKGFQNGVKSTLTDAAFVIMNAALATREEAPAEAGGLEWKVDYNAVVAVSAHLQKQGLLDSAKAVERMLSRAAAYRNCRDAHAELAALRAQPPAREDAPAEAGERAENVNDAVEFLSRAFPEDGFGFAYSYREVQPAIAALITALRAQPPARIEARDCGNGHQPGCDCDVPEEDVARSKPPAREDAQPVAWRGRIFETSSVWDYKSFDMTGELWSDVQPLYLHPAPDALRVAVEALKFYRDAWNSEPNGDPRIEGDANGSLTEPADALLDDKGARASEALAALQAEQGAK